MNRPPFNSISIAAALRRDWTGYILQEKLDGRYFEYRIGQTVFVGELMPSKEFTAFDCVEFGGLDIRNDITEYRLIVMVRQAFLLKINYCDDFYGNNHSKCEIKKLLSSGAEGIVAKPTRAKFGEGWIKAKVSETHDCTVTAIVGESIRLIQDGVDRGGCPVTGGKLIDGWDYQPRIAKLKVGDIVEIACHSIHESGLFREPRLVRVRDDKS